MKYALMLLLAASCGDNIRLQQDAPSFSTVYLDAPVDADMRGVKAPPVDASTYGECIDAAWDAAPHADAGCREGGDDRDCGTDEGGR